MFIIIVIHWQFIKVHRSPSAKNTVECALKKEWLSAKWKRDSDTKKKNRIQKWKDKRLKKGIMIKNNPVNSIKNKNIWKVQYQKSHIRKQSIRKILKYSCYLKMQVPRKSRNFIKNIEEWSTWNVKKQRGHSKSTFARNFSFWPPPPRTFALVYAFLIKKTPSYAGLGSKQKAFSNCQAAYQKELCLLFENQAIFFTEQTYR